MNSKIRETARYRLAEVWRPLNSFALSSGVQGIG